MPNEIYIEILQAGAIHQPRSQFSLINPFTGGALFSTSLANAQTAAALGLLGGGLALGNVI